MSTMSLKLCNSMRNLLKVNSPTSNCSTVFHNFGRLPVRTFKNLGKNNEKDSTHVVLWATFLALPIFFAFPLRLSWYKQIFLDLIFVPEVPDRYKIKEEDYND